MINYLLLSFVRMAIDSQDLSINNVFTESPAYSSHDVLAAMLNMFLVVVPGLNIGGVKSSPKLLPPREHAMENMPLSRGKVPSTSLREIIYVCTVDGNELG
jgi:hypothetical protein